MLHKIILVTPIFTTFNLVNLFLPFNFLKIKIKIRSMESIKKDILV